MLADPAGLTATGEAGVLIVPRVDIAGPPVAPDLTAVVRPGRTIRIDPLADVTDPAGSRVSLVESAVVTPPDVTVTLDDDSLLLTAPPTETVLSMRYTVVNESGLQATGSIAVTVSELAVDPVPLAGDVVVPPSDLGEGAATVEVSVADRVTNRTGRKADLQLSVHPVSTSSARVLGPMTLEVTLSDRRQVIAYQVTDGVGGTATAMVVVPPRHQLVGPQLVGTEIQLNAGTTVDLALTDHVSVADGDPQLADGYPVRVTQGAVERLDARRLRLSAPSTAGGPAVLYLPIRTGDGTPTVLSVPVLIIPRVVPPPELDGAVLDVEVGTAETLDLAPLTLTFDAPQRESLRWAAGAGGPGVTATVEGSVLSVSLTATVARGAESTVPIEVTDGDGRTAKASVTVRATGSRKPLPTVVPQRIDGVRPGQPVTADLLLGSADPIGLGLEVSDLTVTTGAAGIATGPELTGSTVTFTTAVGFSGEITLGFRVLDGTKDSERIITSTLVATVADRPGAPGTPAVVEGSRTASSVRLSWTPSDPHGSPLTGYTVTGGGIITQCPAETCVIDGLPAGVPAMFTVVAHNAVGDSPPSATSAPVIPDATPAVPAAPVTAWVSRGVLDVAWSAPTGDFSPVTGVDLQILAGGRSIQVIPALTGTSYRAEGLDPSTAYTFQVRATNREGTGDWSAAGAAVIPSGVPGAPSVVAAYQYDGGAAQVLITWDQPTDTGGEPVLGYQISLGGQSVQSVDGGTRQLLVPVSGTGSRTVDVVATNNRGPGPGGSTTIVLFTRPGAPGAVTASPADGALQVSWGQGSTPGSSVGRYDYQVDGGGWTSAGTATAATVGGLSNGTAYTVGVRVCNAVGGYPETAVCSDPATAAAAVPYGAPPPPVLDATANRDTVSATWSFPAGDMANGRPITSKSVRVTGAVTENPDPAAGSWTRVVGWNKQVTIVVEYCVSGPTECVSAPQLTRETERSWTLRAAEQGVCAEKASTGGPWLRRADCEAADGRWVTGQVEVLSCSRGGPYFTDPDAVPTTVVTTAVSTTVTTTAPITRTEPGPPPTTVTTSTTLTIPTTTTVTTTSTVSHPQTNSWYVGTDGRFYRTVVLAGEGPPC